MCMFSAMQWKYQKLKWMSENEWGEPNSTVLLPALDFLKKGHLPYRHQDYTLAGIPKFLLVYFRSWQTSA